MYIININKIEIFYIFFAVIRVLQNFLFVLRMIIQIKIDIPVRRERLVHAIGALSTPFFQSGVYAAKTQAIAK